MWLFDAVPAWTTSLVVVVLLLFCASDSSLWFLRESETLGKLVSYKAILHCFVDPIIMLFIGGLQQYTVVWDLGDVGIGLMTVFNILFLYPMSGEVLKLLEKYKK